MLRSNPKFLTLPCIGVLLLLSGAPASVGRAQVEIETPSAESTRALMDQYCITCHSQRAQIGGLDLESVDLAQPEAHAEVLESVIVRLRSGAMPPVGNPRPDPATYRSTVGWLESELARWRKLAGN